MHGAMLASAALRAAGIGVLALAVAAPAAAGGDGAAATVTMTDRLTYEPETVIIEAGETVQWRNTSLLMHTVTADPDEATRPASVALPDGAATFDSGRMQEGDTFRHTFDVPGTYTYFCIPHEGARMVGEVIVE